MLICIVEDDPVAAELSKLVLAEEGHDIRLFASSEAALAAIPTIKPDVVISDIMMAGMDGIELCARLQNRPDLPDLKVIMLSSKAYDFDRKRARDVGAVGFILKPIIPATFSAQVLACLKDTATVRYWGVRGTLPVPGKRALKYGGNTICVTMEFPRQRNFIFDGGTGIKELSNDLMERRVGKWSAKMFISHPHWDHINAIPYFVPMYLAGNEFEIIGAKHGKKTMRDLISAQMDDVYFPVNMTEMGASISFTDIEPGTYQFDGIEVKTMYLSHPGKCLGYRVNFGGLSYCYITDNEIYPQNTPHNNPHFEAELAAFMKNADIAVMDACYLEEEYRKKVHWGHSSVNEVVRIAHAAEVKELHLFHHDPDQDDLKIDFKAEIANDVLSSLRSKTRCVVPKEGDSIVLE